MSLLKRNNGGLVPFRGMLSDFFETDDLMLNRMLSRETVPAVNISETEKNFEIELVAPGLRKGDFKIKVDNNVLTISAEREEKKEEKEKNYSRQEYTYNSFTRSFTLPEIAKSDDIKAHYEDGLLHLTIAKKALAASKAKEIAVV